MSRRTLFILLFVSLALNLFVLGAAAGAFLFGDRLHPARPPGMRGGGPPMFAAAAALPPAEAEAYREALSAEALAVRPKLHEAHRMRREAWLKLGADPVDAAGIAAELDKARELQAQAQSEVDRKIVEVAARLPAADRGRFAEAISQPPMWRGPGRDRRGGGPPPDARP